MATVQCPRTTQAGRRCQRQLTVERVALAGAGGVCGVCSSQGVLTIQVSGRSVDALRAQADAAAGPTAMAEDRVEELTGGSWESYQARAAASPSELRQSQVALAGRYGWEPPAPDDEYFDVWHEPDGDHFYAVRVTTDRDLHPEEVMAMAQGLGYGIRANVGGDGAYGLPERVGPRSWELAIDSTKNSRDEAPGAWDNIRQAIVEGSPVRKTDRAGAGTKGTRLTQGIGPVGLTFHVS